jgi:predicted KAP-like P-loop ATPase
VFLTYFRLATPEGVVSNSEFQGLLATANDPAVFGRGLQRLASEFLPEGRSRVRDVLERLVDYAEEGLPNEVRTHVLNALADVGNDLLLPADTPGGLLEFDNSTLISRVIYRLTKPFDQETRFRLLFDAYSDGSSLGLIVHEISILGQEHGKHTSSQQVSRSENERIVSAAQLAKLEELGLKRIREAAATGSDLVDDPLVGAILHRWREWGPPQEAASWVAGGRGE